MYVARSPVPLKPLAPLPPGDNPRIGVGLPVRNGGSMLEAALLSLTQQTHKNLEIILSDNASTDGSREVCERFARMDPRIRYFRHEETLNATENARFVLDKSECDWFMWAAHDDLRDLNYVEVLLSGFAANPQAPLVFTDTVYFKNHANPEDAVPAVLAPRSTTGIPFPERHRVVVANGPCAIYGLFRMDVLRAYRWPEVPVGGDWAILHFCAALGELIYVPGSNFRYFPVVRTPAEARKHRGTGGYLFTDYLLLPPDVRWAYHASAEVAYARRVRGLDTDLLSLYRNFLFIQHGGPKVWAKSFVYRNAPAKVRSAWHSLKLHVSP
jgi:hypothetical protein